MAMAPLRPTRPAAVVQVAARSAGSAPGTSVVVFAIYYIGLIGGEDLGDRLIVTPFLAMWAPNLICGVLGLLGLWVVSREGGMARGGSLADLLFWWRRP